MTPTPYKLEKRSQEKIESPLLTFARNVSSQCGEDGVIERIFQIIPEAAGYFVEFGAWDGHHLSNCWNLAIHHGWEGCFIEADKARFSDLRVNHGSNSRVRCVNALVQAEGPQSLDSILVSLGAPRAFGLLSIDIDGMDYFVWEGLRAFRPSVVVIEFNPTVPNDVLFVQAKDSRVNQGCSLLALVDLAKVKGYELACCTAFNAFFVCAELYPRLGILDNSISRLYRPLMDGRIFHGYDSSIYVAGMPGLVWANIALTSDDFQVLPKSRRIFHDGKSAG